MKHIDPDMVHLSTIHPQDGRALRYHVDEMLATWIPKLADELSNHRYVVAASDYFEKDLLQMYLEQSLYLELIDVIRAYYRRQYLRLTGEYSGKPVTCPSRLYNLVKQYWPDSSIGLKRTGIRYSFTLLTRRLRMLKANFWQNRATKPILPGFNKGMIAVELVEGSDTREKCDAFWLHGDIIDPSRVIFVIDPTNRVLLDLEKEINNIQKLGSYAVALHPNVSHGMTIPLWRQEYEQPWVEPLRKHFKSPRTKFDKWIRRTLLHAVERVSYWETFFQVHNIIVFQQFTEFTLETSIKRIAVKRVDGIEIGKMRSQFFEISSAAFHFQHEVAFVWHQNVRRYLKYGHTRTKEIIDTGYVYDYLFDVCKSKAEKIRSSLQKAGASIIIAVYDNYPHINGHFNLEQLEEFYRYILDLMESDPRIGLIVKSKKPHILRFLPTIRSSLLSLEENGRCVILQDSMTAVAPSALAADIAIGMPASTAVSEAALAGCRVIMYDPGGARDHVFVGDDKRIIFKDMDAFKTAVKGLINDPKGSPYGDASNIVSEIDSKRDLSSYVRAADFLRNYMEAKENGHDSNKSLRVAIRQQSLVQAAVNRASS